MFHYNIYGALLRHIQVVVAAEHDAVCSTEANQLFKCLSVVSDRIKVEPPQLFPDISLSITIFVAYPQPFEILKISQRNVPAACGRTQLSCGETSRIPPKIRREGVIAESVGLQIKFCQHIARMIS